MMRSCRVYDNSGNIFAKEDALFLENYNQKKHRQIISQLKKPVFTIGQTNSLILDEDDIVFPDTIEDEDQSGSESNIF